LESGEVMYMYWQRKSGGWMDGWGGGSGNEREEGEMSLLYLKKMLQTAGVQHGGRGKKLTDGYYRKSKREWSSYTQIPTTELALWSSIMHNWNRYE
jgi:hypothetical protein